MFEESYCLKSEQLYCLKSEELYCLKSEVLVQENLELLESCSSWRYVHTKLLKIFIEINMVSRLYVSALMLLYHTHYFQTAFLRISVFSVQ